MNHQPSLRFPLHIVIIYCLTGAAWILFSDLLVVAFIPASYHGVISIAKGWLFISVTAAILALLLHRYQRTQASLERRMREIIDNLPSILYVFDRDGRAVLFNRAMVTLFGLDGSDYRGMSREELGIAPEAVAAHLANDRRVFETGQAVIAEEENLHADRRHTYLTAKFPLTADDGSIEAVCGISTDITERKRAETVLSESEHRYRSLFENMVEGFAFCRMLFTNGEPQDFVYIAVNDAFTDLTGLKNVVGRRVSEVIPGIREADPELFEIYGRVARSGQPERFEIYVQSLQMWFYISVYSPESEHFVAVFDVITKRKQAEAEREQYWKFFQSSSNLMCIAGTDGYFKKINPSFSRALGYSAAELLAQPFVDFIHPEDRDSTMEAIAKELQVGSTLNFQNRYLCKDGSFRWLSWRTTYDAQDGLIYAIAIDTTEQKQSEEEREKLQRQLNQSQKMEALGQLAGGVAHDFNNILSVIMGYGHMLKMGTGLDHQQQEKLDHIITAAEKAAHLTGGLLAFSRKQVLAPKTVDLNDLVQHLEKFLVRVIGEDIRLQTHLASDHLQVSIDSGSIEQALINLATNARDAMPDGGALTIETGRQEIDGAFVHLHGYGQAGSYAVITVADSGCGMDDKTRKKIFEPFFTTKESGKGTGLGMAIVYGIVKQHNGFINVFSEPGKGTTCRIYLPLVEQHAPMTRAAQAVPVPPRSGNETILVAEDEPAVQKLVAGILSDYGYRVLLAGDGREVVELFAANRDTVTLILMDMIMPIQSGKAAADEIRRLQPGVKILFASGYTADFIKSRGVDDGDGDELIMKPFQPLELLRKVREILDV